MQTILALAAIPRHLTWAIVFPEYKNITLYEPKKIWPCKTCVIAILLMLFRVTAHAQVDQMLISYILPAVNGSPYPLNNSCAAAVITGMNASGKTYVIAGASSGIGLALARLLLDQGARVHALSRHTGPLEGVEGFHHYTVDFLESVELPLIEGAIDGLVYCPGSITLKSAERLTTADIDRDFTLNAKAAFQFVQKYLRNLKSSGSASVVLFSTVAVQTGMPFHISVAMAKGAVEGLTRSLAAELAPGIRVNAIAPSLTDTPLAATLLNTDAKREAAVLRHPLRKVGDAAELASLAMYLLTAGNWITGQVIGANGGLGTLIK